MKRDSGRTGAFGTCMAVFLLKKTLKIIIAIILDFNIKLVYTNYITTICEIKAEEANRKGEQIYVINQ